MANGIGGSTAAAELAAIKPWDKPAPRITRDEREARIDAARALMHKAGTQALLIGAGASLDYFTGIPWGPSERLVAMLLPLTSPSLRVQRIALWTTMVLLSYSAVNLAWRNGAIALGIAAIIPLGWQVIHHERRRRRDLDVVEET